MLDEVRPVEADEQQHSHHDHQEFATDNEQEFDQDHPQDANFQHAEHQMYHPMSYFPMMEDRSVQHADAVLYIKLVQSRTTHDPELFNQFLDVLRQFREEGMSNMRQIAERVVTILQGYPDLVIGFNTFLPEGYGIALNMANPSQPYVIIEPPPASNYSYHMPYFNPASSSKLNMHDALSFLSQVRTCTQAGRKPGLYKKFKAMILKNKSLPITQRRDLLLKDVEALFKAFPDLFDSFKRFTKIEDDEEIMDEGGIVGGAGGGAGGGIGGGVVGGICDTVDGATAANALLSLVEARRFFLPGEDSEELVKHE